MQGYFWEVQDTTGSKVYKEEVPIKCFTVLKRICTCNTNMSCTVQGKVMDF